MPSAGSGYWSTRNLINLVVLAGFYLGEGLEFPIAWFEEQASRLIRFVDVMGGDLTRPPGEELTRRGFSDTCQGGHVPRHSTHAADRLLLAPSPSREGWGEG